MDSSSTPKNASSDHDSDMEPEINEPEMMNAENGGQRKDVPGTSRVTTPPVKGSKTRSTVWTHFTRTKEDRNRCICHYCRKNFGCASSSGTSNLQKHLKSCKQYLAWEERRQALINEEGNLKKAKVSEEVFREACNAMLVLGELPLSFIESVAWKYFCKQVNLYKPQSRRTATRHIVKSYVQKKLALRDWFMANKKRVSLTTDIWTAQNTGASYMVITAHFIDDCWSLRKLIIGFKFITDHKGHTISSVLKECLVEWGIDKIFCITVDNATANTSALRRFQRDFQMGSVDAFVLGGEYMHMRCAAHILNLIVKEGLAEIDDSVCAIRNAVSYVRSSSSRLRSFELRVDSGKMTRGSLPLDVKTRWNSTYLMLTRAIKYKVAFDKMEAEDKLYNDHFMEVDNERKRIGPPQRCDWSAIERLVKFLIIFYNSTLIVSASTTLNASSCYGEIVTIERNLMSLRDSVEPELKLKADAMLTKFDRYWDGMVNINKMLIIATVFDPRQKMQFARYCFDRLYGKESLEAKEMNHSVLIILRSMFSEYSSRYDNGSNMQSSQSTHNSSNSSQEQAFERMELVNDMGYERMDFMYKEMVDEIGVEDARDELEIYLNERVENPKTIAGIEYDILSWWKTNCYKFPILSEMAKDLLAMQVSSVASESAFSTSGQIITPHRSCLTHYMIEVLLCSEQWLKAELKAKETRIVTMEQILSEFEYEDTLVREYENLQINED